LGIAFGKIASGFRATLGAVATDASPLAADRKRRVVLLVAIAAAVAAGVVVGVTVFQTHGEHTTFPGAVTKARSGPPPLQLEFSLAESSEARALAQAETLLDKYRQPAQAAAIFRRYHSLEAQLGALFAGWRGPESLAAVKTLVAANSHNPAALLNLGWADYQAGRNADAIAAWRRAASEFPDSPYGVDAQDALHPTTIPGLPIIVTGLAPPDSIGSLSPVQQLAALKRAAEKNDPRAKIVYGAALWNLRRPLSAERQFAAAAKLAPQDPLARTLAAVGLFSKGNSVRAFGRLGPLTGVFPHSAAVQFHLGVLLLYVGERAKAAQHLSAAAADGPQSPYAKPARTLLTSLGNTRSK
jgi:Flp pilus assembly protein TadD